MSIILCILQYTKLIYMKNKKQFNNLKTVELYNKGYKTTQIADFLKISVSSIHYYLKKNGLKTPENGETIRKFNHFISIFEKIDTEEKAYWLGFLYADGYNCASHRYIRLTLSTKDENHLIKFRDFIGGRKEIKNIFSTNSVYLSIYSSKICNDLINLGCFQNKTFILKFPTEDQVPSHLIHHFIRGYFDGDGSVFTSNEKHHRSNKIEPIIHCRIMSTKDFLTKMIEILNIGNNKCIKQIDNVHEYQIKRKIRCEKLYDYLYKDATVFLERKKKIFDDYFN